MMQKRLDINSINNLFTNTISKAKLRAYCRYYDRSNKFAQPIIVDESTNLIDGYSSYEIAKIKGLQYVEVTQISGGKTLDKCIIGRHLTGSRKKRKEKKNLYIWIYPLRASIVPGDLVIASNKNGMTIIQVVDIVFQECNSGHKEVIYKLSNSKNESKNTLRKKDALAILGIQYINEKMFIAEFNTGDYRLLDIDKINALDSCIFAEENLFLDENNISIRSNPVYLYRNSSMLIK